MKQNIKINYFIFFIITFYFSCSIFNTSVFAGEKRISLSDAIKIALHSNNELRAFKNSVYAKENNIGIAKSFLYPHITFGETYMGTNNPVYVFMSKLNEGQFKASDFNINTLNNPSAYNDFQTNLSVEVPLFVRKANIGISMAKKEFLSKKNEFRREKETISFYVIQAYLRLYTAKEYLSVAKKGLQDSIEHLRVAQARNKAGLGLYSDVLRTQTSVTNAKQGVITAETNIKVAKRALGLLLGMSKSVNITDEYPLIPLHNIRHYINVALTRNDIKALKLKYENAKNNIKLAESGYLPTVGVEGSYQLNDHNVPLGSEGSSWQVIVGLQWKWFDGEKRKQEISKAKHQMSEIKNYLSGLIKQIKYHVYKAYLHINEAKEGIRLAKSSFKTAKEGERLVMVRYANGISPIVDLLDAQVNLDNARVNIVAKENEYRLDVVNLCYESGTILKDFYNLQ